jgi:hypothetical protein
VSRTSLIIAEFAIRELGLTLYPDLSLIWGYPFRAKVGMQAVRRTLEKCTPNSGTGVFKL